MFLVGVHDVIHAPPEPFSIVPDEICGLQWFCASTQFTIAFRSGICGGSFLLTSGRKQYRRQNHCDERWGKRGFHRPNDKEMLASSYFAKVVAVSHGRVV
jgi:hypothetical protein